MPHYGSQKKPRKYPGVEKKKENCLKLDPFKAISRQTISKQRSVFSQFSSSKVTDQSMQVRNKFFTRNRARNSLRSKTRGCQMPWSTLRVGLPSRRIAILERLSGQRKWQKREFRTHLLYNYLFSPQSNIFYESIDCSRFIFSIFQIEFS